MYQKILNQMLHVTCNCFSNIKPLVKTNSLLFNLILICVHICGFVACDDGTYGFYCRGQCSGHCLNGSHCNIQTGSCDRGCNPGYIDIDCSKRKWFVNSSEWCIKKSWISSRSPKLFSRLMERSVIDYTLHFVLLLFTYILLQYWLFYTLSILKLDIFIRFWWE